MDTGDLHRPRYCADILVNALNQDPARPLLGLLDGPTLTVGEVRDATSQFVQALRSLGVKPGTRIGMLSANRPGTACESCRADSGCNQRPDALRARYEVS